MTIAQDTIKKNQSLEDRLGAIKARIAVLQKQADRVEWMMRLIPLIQSCVCKEYGLSSFAGLASAKYATAVEAKRVAVVLFQKHTDLSYPEIATIMGLRRTNHASVHGQHKAGLDRPEVLAAVAGIEEKIGLQTAAHGGYDSPSLAGTGPIEGPTCESQPAFSR